MKRAACLGLLFVSMMSFTAYSAIDPCIEITWQQADGKGGAGSWLQRYGNSDKRSQVSAYVFKIQDRQELDGCLVELDMIYDEDPFVNGIFAVTNNTASDKIYTFTFTAPVNPAITTSTLYGGSMSGSYTDSNKNGSILVSTTGGDPLYQGMIDGADIFPIYSDPYSWTALNMFGSGDILAAGDFVDNLGPQALSTISLEYKFLLSAGDTVTMNGTFEVIPIPEPATLALLGLGGLLLRKRN